MTSDQFMAALALWREARNQTKAAKAAVYAVMLNRTTDAKNRWPRTVWEVVLQPWQFSSFNRNDPNATLFPMPGRKSDWAAWLECLAVVEAPIGGDSTNGANHYHDSSIAPPFTQWLGRNATLADLVAKETCKVGAFTFYKL